MAKIMLLALLLGTSATPASAQDYLQIPANHFSAYSETTLSGVDVHNDSVETIIEKLGLPNEVKTRLNEWSTDHIYEWQTTSYRLRLITRESGWRALHIERLDVWGTRPAGVIGTTGRGLKLGDAIGQARLLYRHRAASNNSASLEIDFDRRGRVNHMQLNNYAPYSW